ncbi:MAG TPA: hypothetical protein VJV79_15165 [Polyangiaceae bacterium]|nr:hypothetical protein [Polyangiaceae bacterium]
MLRAAAFALTWSAGSGAQQNRELRLEVRAACPNRGLLEAELAPLLRGYQLDEAASTALVAQVEDLGESYTVRLGNAAREVSDPARQCLERARVAAVFLALNLPALEDDAQSEGPSPAASPPSVDEPSVAPAVRQREHEARASRTAHSLDLRLFGFAETTPDAAAMSTGAGVGASLPFGPWALTFLGGVSTPTRPFHTDAELPKFELWRVPFAALLGYNARWGVAGVGLEAGLALDLLRFRGEAVPNPESSLRLNPGLRLGAVLRLRASQRLAALLSPSFSYFPRSYSIRVEPSSTLAETPPWWLGASLGLEYSFGGDEVFSAP